MSTPTTTLTATNNASRMLWERMGPEDRNALAHAAQYGQALGIEGWREAEAEARAEGTKKGIEFITPDDAMLKAANAFTEQHLASARMRAVEEGLPVVRAANTGISAIIDAKGEIIARLETGQTGVIDATLPTALAPTPYARFGDWTSLALICAVWALAFTVGSARRRFNSEKSKAEES